MLLRLSRVLALSFVLLAAAAPVRSACVDLELAPMLPVPAPCADMTLEGVTIVVHSLGGLEGLIGEPPASTYWQHGCVAAGFQNYVVEVSAPTTEGFASVFKFGDASEAQAMFDDPAYGAIGLEFDTWPGVGPHRYFVTQDRGIIYFRERCLYGIVGTPIANDDITPLWCLATALLANIGQVVGDETRSWGEVKRSW